MTCRFKPGDICIVMKDLFREDVIGKRVRIIDVHPKNEYSYYAELLDGFFYKVSDMKLTKRSFLEDELELYKPILKVFLKKKGKKK